MLAVTQRLTPRSYLHQPLKSMVFIYFQSALIRYIVFFFLPLRWYLAKSKETGSMDKRGTTKTQFCYLNTVEFFPPSFGGDKDVTCSA